MRCPTRFPCEAHRRTVVRPWWNHHFIFLICACLVLLLTSTADAAVLPSAASKVLKQPTHVLTHVTFASCNRQHDDQSYWMNSIAPTVAKERKSATAHTDLLLWLGNAVYTDVDESGVAMSRARAPDGIDREYKALTGNRHYRQFVEEVVESGGGRVVGIWDDRDLGMRFANSNYTQSVAVRRLYLTHFWKGYPLSVKDNTGEGAHGALYSFTTVPAPANSPLANFFLNSVCTITLDVRTQRSALPNLVHALLRGTTEDGLRMYGTRGKHLDRQIHELRAERAKVMEADLLGEAQWAWLEKTIRTYLAAGKPSPGDEAGRAHCAVTLIASPWQILLNDNKPFEGWDLYPSSRSKLLLLLKKHAVARVILLSGHAEIGELGVVRRAAKADITLEGPAATLVNSFPLTPMTKSAAKLSPPLPSYLVELTTGGLTHTAFEAPVVGRLASWLTTPRTAEDKMENGFVKRHVFLTRTTTAERNFGTLQIIGDAGATAEAAKEAPAATTQSAVLQRTRVILTLHRVKDGSPLVTFDKALEELPSYAVQPLLDEYNEKEEMETTAMDLHDVTHLPVFTTFNVPGDIPWLKRRLAERQCAEVPCANGQLFMLLKVMGTLTLAFVVMLLFIAAVYYYQLRNPGGPAGEVTKLKMD
ncbi:hypothetical protein ABL78_1858 [Leptomonas seymouri]|uniref:Uncharacterized protein n=1 Tax=Leptomonas seymouri TaxID=5684 RepID=A0A0N1I1M6_LEPSE|nr:hypothetical protein ABL78_1858 [Leptomonas seymouri]|eukprot:KPI89045.1 hypothetical protein ABL78_1858 [Leptomonas seymouri]